MDQDSLMNQAKAIDGSAWKSLLGFDKMVTPTIIKILYFLLLLGILASVVTMLVQGSIFAALGILIFGTLWVRVICESMIVMFRIHDQISVSTQYLKDIRDRKSLG